MLSLLVVYYTMISLYWMCIVPRYHYTGCVLCHDITTGCVLYHDITTGCVLYHEITTGCIFLTTSALKTLIQACVTTCLDYANSILYGLPISTTKLLQRVQNTAARVITRTNRCDRTTPALAELYWLPIQSRVYTKFCC